jgi:succinate dehydrogenase hydrophobic anchor subunit
MRISVGIFWLSVTAALLGFSADLKNDNKLFNITREHYWAYASYLIVLSSTVHFVLGM